METSSIHNHPPEISNLVINSATLAQRANIPQPRASPWDGIANRLAA